MGTVQAAQAQRRLATYEDLLALPEDVRAEILDGQLVTMPAPLPVHGRVQRALARFIGGPFDDDDGRGGPGGWWILLEVDVRLGPHDVVRPDVAGWRREHLPDPWYRRPIDVVPDWVCEVLSASTALRDLRDKRALYGRSGVGYYWVVDPEHRTVQVWRRQEVSCSPPPHPSSPAQGAPGWRWQEVGVWGDGDEAALPPFEAVTLEVGRLFPPQTQGWEGGGAGR